MGHRRSSGPKGPENAHPKRQGHYRVALFVTNYIWSSLKDSTDIDGLGRLIQADETLTKTSGATVNYDSTYTYDMRSQLIEAQIQDIGEQTWTALYNYYKNGNINYRTIQQSQTSFTYNAELMTGTSQGESMAINWDENGNMMNQPKATDNGTFVYNWDNKLRSAAIGSYLLSLKYDPLGNRIYKGLELHSSGGPIGGTYQRKYIVDIVGDLPTILLELEPDDEDSFTIEKTYVYANSQILAQYTDPFSSAAKYLYLHDRLGSVRQVIDTLGNADVQCRYTYDPFGELFDSEAEETEGLNPFKFTGQYFDDELGQYYLRARQYDPHIARFTSRDPVTGKFEEPLTLHKYLYCTNDPINKLDPSGLEPILITPE